MNCPGHVQIFNTGLRSYRDLPLRLAEFGSVYRYEQSGELNGLTRVRSFTVDDSHLFVAPEQLEIKSRRSRGADRQTHRRKAVRAVRRSRLARQGDGTAAQRPPWSLPP